MARKSIGAQLNWRPTIRLQSESGLTLGTFHDEEEADRRAEEEARRLGENVYFYRGTTDRYGMPRTTGHYDPDGEFHYTGY